MRDRVGVRPVIEMAHAEDDRQEQHRHDRQRPHRGFERPADHHAPRAARQVLHHQQRHAAEHDAHPERVGDEVRLVEAIDGPAITKPAIGQHEADDRGDGAQPLQPRQTLSGGLIRFSRVMNFSIFTPSFPV